MGTNTRRRQWIRHGLVILAILFSYSLVMFVFAPHSPSVRIADAVTVSPGFRMGEVVYHGELVQFGWPSTCCTWRMEAEGPIRTPESSRMRIVAVRVSILAVMIDVSFVIAAYSLVIIAYTS